MMDSSVERRSLCKVSESHDGNKQLIRLADIEDGILEEFKRDEGMPRNFDNRDRLYWRDGPSSGG